MKLRWMLQSGKVKLYFWATDVEAKALAARYP